MGMSTTVVGIRPPDDKWRQMKAIYDACEAAGTTMPKEVEEFFEYERPDDKGVLIYESKLGECVSEYKTEWEQGYEVDLTRLPKDITIIRFYNSW